MENKPKPRSAARNLLYTLILLLVVLLLVEVVFSIFFYHKHGNEKLATIEAMKMARQMMRSKPTSANTGNQKLVRPNAGEDVNRQIAEETNFSNKFE
jgi:flagellar basal body-associated protein FliL